MHEDYAVCWSEHGDLRPRDWLRSKVCRILVIDSERALAEALAAQLADEPGVAAAWAASDPLDAARILAGTAVDVLVAGLDAEDWDVLTLLSRISSEQPHISIVSMSGAEDHRRVAAAVKAGATSWVPKQAGVKQLSAVVCRASIGESWMPPRMLRGVLRQLTAHEASGDALDDVHASLTMRERQILDFMAQGLGRREIAARLDVSVNTVRTHIQHLLTKLGVHSVLEAVALALRHNASRSP
jgi:DNA-binding NarL/FixJ family response regulator